MLVGMCRIWYTLFGWYDSILRMTGNGGAQNAGDQQIYELVIKMIFNGNDKHHKPHVHVYYGEYEASVGLDGEVLEEAFL